MITASSVGAAWRRNLRGRPLTQNHISIAGRRLSNVTGPLLGLPAHPRNLRSTVPSALSFGVLPRGCSCLGGNAWNIDPRSSRGRNGGSVQRQTAVRCFTHFDRILWLPCKPPSCSWAERRPGPVRSRPFWSWLLRTIAQQPGVEKAKAGALAPSWSRPPDTRFKLPRMNLRRGASDRPKREVPRSTGRVATDCCRLLLLSSLAIYVFGGKGRASAAWRWPVMLLSFSP